jgi:hypothetical protein
MAKWGKTDFKQLKRLRDQVERLSESDLDAFVEKVAKQLAARLLAKVIDRTPVGIYEDGSGMIGGTLRRGWLAKTEREAEATAAFGGGSSIAAYVKDLTIIKSGNMYQIDIINPVHYGIYVEFGHRTRNHKGWVEGQFMLTISEQELEAQAPAIIEKMLTKYLMEVFK